MVRSARKLSPRMRFFFSRIFPLPFALGGAVALFFGGRGLLRAKASSDWPAAQGKIVASSVERHRGSGRNSSTTYHAEILYEFNVDGVTYNGTRVAYGDYGSSSSSHARRIVNRYPEGKVVTVHYMPGDPEECLLEPGVHLQTCIWPGFGLAFLVAGIAMLLFLPKGMRAYGRLASRGEPVEPSDSGGDEPQAPNGPQDR